MTWPARISSLRERAKQDVLLALLSQGIERATTHGQQGEVSARLSAQFSFAGARHLLIVHLPRGVSPAMLHGKVEEELARLARGVTPVEVARLRHRVLIRWLASWEQLSQRATFQASISRVTGRPITAKDYVAELEAVNEGDVAALAKAFEPRELTEVDWLQPGAEAAN